MADVLLSENKDHVVLLTINRPEAMNCFNFELLNAFGAAIRSANFDPEVRVMIVTGAAGQSKPAFSTGADLAERRTMSEADVRRFIHTIVSTFAEVDNVRVPVIAAVNGFAFGGGLELAMACDIRIASSNAVMGLTETSLAVIPGAGGTQRLPRIIGVARAKELVGRSLEELRSIRRGITAVMTEIESGTFGNIYKGSSLETVVGSIAEQRQIFEGADHAFLWKPKLRILDIYEDRENQVAFGRFLNQCSCCTTEAQVLTAIHDLDRRAIRVSGPAAANMLYFSNDDKRLK